jgi:hypothetical protein
MQSKRPESGDSGRFFVGAAGKADPQDAPLSDAASGDILNTGLAL